MLVVMFSHEVADDVFDNGINSAVSCEKRSKKKKENHGFHLFVVLSFVFGFHFLLWFLFGFLLCFFFLSPFFSGIKNEVFTCSGVLPCCSCVC